MVRINENGKWVFKEPTKDLVYIIVPGAGTYNNKVIYEKIKSDYNVVYIGSSGGVYDSYPLNWEMNGMVEMNGNNLGGLACVIGDRMTRLNEIPALILCGSRGGQITIGKVWESIWRGPTIIINAGCLTTNTQIPIGVKPMFIIMEYDYFTSVNSIGKVLRLFDSLKEKESHKMSIVYLKSQSHMPKYRGDLEGLLCNTIKYMLGDSERIGIKSNRMTIYNN